MHLLKVHQLQTLKFIEFWDYLDMFIILSWLAHVLSVQQIVLKAIVISYTIPTYLPH